MGTVVDFKKTVKRRIPAAGRCWLWHHWEKWSDPYQVERAHYSHGMRMPQSEYVATMQQRKCIQCGRIAQREISASPDSAQIRRQGSCDSI